MLPATPISPSTMIQWGYQTASSANPVVAFEEAFPTACRSVSVTPNLSGGTASGWGYATSVNRGGFTAVVQTPYDFWWIAFGD